MLKIRRLIIVICFLAVTVAFSSCNSVVSISNGNYYLNGDEDSSYINITNGNTLKFVGFNIDGLAEGIEEATGFEEEDLAGFREEYDLHKIFNDEIEFEFDKNDGILYAQITDWIGYMMKREDKNIISFDGNEYIR